MATFGSEYIKMDLEVATNKLPYWLPLGRYMAASSKDVSITYSSNSNKKKNKKGSAQAWSTVQSKKMMQTVHQTKLQTSEQPKDHDEEERD